MPDFAVNPVTLEGGGLFAPDGVSTPPPAATAGLVDAAAGQAGRGASPSYALPPPPFDSVVRFQRALADVEPDAVTPRPTDMRGVAAAPRDKALSLPVEILQVDAPPPATPPPAVPSAHMAAPSPAALPPFDSGVQSPRVLAEGTPTGEISSALGGVLSRGAAATPRTSVGFDAPPPATPPPFDSGAQSPCVLAEGTPTGEISSTPGGVLSRGAAASAVPPQVAVPPPATPSAHVDVPVPAAPPPFDTGAQSPHVLADAVSTGEISSAPGGALSRSAAASATPPQVAVPPPATPSAYMDVPVPAAPPAFDSGAQSPRVLAEGMPTGEISPAPGDLLSRGAAASATPSPTTVPPPAHVDVPSPATPSAYMDVPVPAAPPPFDSGAQSPRVLADAVSTGEISSAPGGALLRGAAATPRTSVGFAAPPPAAPQSEEPAAPHDVPFALGQPPLEVLLASTPSPTPVGAAVAAEAAAASARTETLAVTVSNIVEAVATQLLVTPALAQGEGTVRLVLKPNVLDGAVVTLTAQEGTLTVALTTATPNAASLAAAALPQLEVALASHAPAFHHVAVVLTPARKGLSNETT